MAMPKIKIFYQIDLFNEAIPINCDYFKLF